jgi:hypothetical protein
MSTRNLVRASSSHWTLLLACAASTGLAVAISGVGCDSEPTLLPTGGGGAAGSGGSSTTGAEDKARQLFEALSPALVEACISCHDAGGVSDNPFLKEPVYETITSWPGIIRKNPDESTLVTKPVNGGGHSGTNLDNDQLKDTLFPQIKEWLAEEAKAIASTPEEQKGKSIEPFAPILGFNAVYLTPLGADFNGMAITFNANELTPNTLELTNIEVHSTAKLGLHMVHPLFSVYPKGGNPNPDPADSFSNIDQYIEYGERAVLGPGTLILTNWVPEGKLQLSFEKIEKYSMLEGDGGVDGGLGGGCKNIDSFNMNAKGQFNPCFSMCHGGQDPQATAAVDMTGLVGDADVTNGCAQIRNRVKPEDPPQSQLFITTNPDIVTGHPFKFGGDKNAFNGFQNAVSTWIVTEK